MEPTIFHVRRSGVINASILENTSLKEFLKAKSGYGTWTLGRNECEPFPDGVILRGVRITKFNDDGTVDITWESEAPFEEYQGDE